MKSMETAQKTMKKQFNKKQRNPQGLKVGDNMWLENKNIHLNRSLKKLDQKRYGPFRISKDIGLGVMICVRTNIFLFLLSIFLDFIFLFFFFLLIIKRHMTAVT